MVRAMGSAEADGDLVRGGSDLVECSIKIILAQIELSCYTPSCTTQLGERNEKANSSAYA